VAHVVPSGALKIALLCLIIVLVVAAHPLMSVIISGYRCQHL